MSFVDEGFITFLWNLIILYPFNNILHVRIRRIFNAILQIESIRSYFLSTFEIAVLNTAKQHFELLRPFVYAMWMETRQYLTANASVGSEFKALVEEHL